MRVHEVLEVLCEALEIRPGSLKPDTPIADVEAWDSIGWMNVVAVADRQFNTQITNVHVRTFRTAGDVAHHLLSGITSGGNVTHAS